MGSDASYCKACLKLKFCFLKLQVIFLKLVFSILNSFFSCLKMHAIYLKMKSSCLKFSFSCLILDFSCLNSLLIRCGSSRAGESICPQSSPFQLASFSLKSCLSLRTQFQHMEKHMPKSSPQPIVMMTMFELVVRKARACSLLARPQSAFSSSCLSQLKLPLQTRERLMQYRSSQSNSVRKHCSAWQINGGQVVRLLILALVGEWTLDHLVFINNSGKRRKLSVTLFWIKKLYTILNIPWPWPWPKWPVMYDLFFRPCIGMAF